MEQRQTLTVLVRIRILRCRCLGDAAKSGLKGFDFVQQIEYEGGTSKVDAEVAL